MAHLALPCLGLVPRIAKRRRSGVPLINNGVPPKFSEAFKRVRTMRRYDVCRRKWLKSHHGSTREIWLVFHKRHTGVASIGYDDAVEEAMC